MSAWPLFASANGLSREKPFAPDAWLEIAPTGEIRIWCGRSEIGQGVRTSLPMIVAEELCCNGNKVHVVLAEAYSYLKATNGSTRVARRAGM